MKPAAVPIHRWPSWPDPTRPDPTHDSPSGPDRPVSWSPQWSSWPTSRGQASRCSRAVRGVLNDNQCNSDNIIALYSALQIQVKSCSILFYYYHFIFCWYHLTYLYYYFILFLLLLIFIHLLWLLFYIWIVFIYYIILTILFSIDIIWLIFITIFFSFYFY